jgi:hypothetical protein
MEKHVNSFFSSTILFVTIDFLFIIIFLSKPSAFHYVSTTVFLVYDCLQYAWQLFIY